MEIIQFVKKHSILTLITLIDSFTAKMTTSKIFQQFKLLILNMKQSNISEIKLTDRIIE